MYASNTSNDRHDEVAPQTGDSAALLDYQISVLSPLLSPDLANRIKSLALVRAEEGCLVRVVVTSTHSTAPRTVLFQVGESKSGGQFSVNVVFCVALVEQLTSMLIGYPDGSDSTAEIVQDDSELVAFAKSLLSQRDLPASTKLAWSQMEDLAAGRRVSKTAHPSLPSVPPPLLQSGQSTATAHKVLDPDAGKCWPSMTQLAHSNALDEAMPNTATGPADRYKPRVMTREDFERKESEDAIARPYYRKCLTEKEKKEDEEEEEKSRTVMVDPAGEKELEEEGTPPSSPRDETTPSDLSSEKSSGSSPPPSSSGERSGAGGEDESMGVPRTPTHSTPPPSAHPTPSTPSTLSTNSDVSPVRPPTRKRHMSLADLETQPAHKLAKWVISLREENKLRREHETLAAVNAYEMRAENHTLEAHLDKANAELAVLSPRFGPLQQHEADALSIKSRLEAVAGQPKMDAKIDKKTAHSTVLSFWRSITATYNCRLRMMKSLANSAIPRLTQTAVTNEANRAAIEAFVEHTPFILDGLDELKKQADTFYALVIREKGQGGKVRSSAALRGMYEGFKKAGNSHLETVHQWDGVCRLLSSALLPSYSLFLPSLSWQLTAVATGRPLLNDNGAATGRPLLNDNGAVQDRSEKREKEAKSATSVPLHSSALFQKRGGMPKARKKATLSQECIEKNLEEIINVAQKEGVVVDPFTISSRRTVYECPYEGCSREFDVNRLLCHLKTHTKQEICATSCPFCDRRMDSIMLIGHLENSHPDLNVEGELKTLNSSIEARHRAIRDSVKSERSTKRHSVATRMSAVLGSSIFEPSSTNMPYAEFRISLRGKLIENTKVNASLIFKFLVRTNALEWGCLICTDHTGLSFKNPISLRLNALFHLEKHVEDEHFPHLQAIISKEWHVLKQEIPTLPIDKMRRCGDLPIGRSFLSYTLLRDDESVGEMMDVIDRCCLDGQSNKLRNALCLLCHSPFSVSLSKALTTPSHFLVDSHRHLASKGWSEFGEVKEIAVEAIGEKREVHSTLAFSSFLHLTNEEHATPRKLFKWRCTLCSLDVAVFPSSISLRFFALRHLERDHPRAFNDLFYDHEWSLLQIETSLVKMRRFSQTAHIQQQGRPIDITDPSDFLFPWPRSLRVTPPEYFVCGHCFFVSTVAEIKDHLKIHGFIQGESIGIVNEDGGKEGMIDEKTIRKIRKCLSVPPSILYDDSLMGEYEKKEGTDDEGGRRPLTPSTPRTVVALMDTPKSKYTLRARSMTARYVPLEEDTNNDTMSSEESDSGLEKNYQWMSGDDETMEETAGEEEDITVQPSMGSSDKKKSKNSNTCTESSVALDDLFDTGIVVPPEKGELSRKRERERVHERAFRWEGEEPDKLTAEQVELIREFKEDGRCSLCPRTKGYRGVSRMTNVEQSMMAHLIVNHADSEDAMAIVTRKRYLLATCIQSGGVDTLPPFLLQSIHPHHLTCSRCMEFKCARQSNLVIHWETCTGVRGVKRRSTNQGREGVTGERKTQKRVMNSVRCPLCREGWRKSTHYSDDVSVAIHLMMKHTTDQKAYAMAMQLEEETNMQSSFPFVHLSDSFALRIEQSNSGIQCAQCNVNSPTLASAIRHATRSHATAAQKIQANFPAGALSCPLPSSSCSLRSILSGRPRSMTAIHLVHVLLHHGRHEEEARQFMHSITQKERDELRDETNLRLDVTKSVQCWESGSTRLVCSLCSLSSATFAVHARHFEEDDCGLVEDRVKLKGTKSRQPPQSLIHKPSPRTPTDVVSREKRGRGKAPECAMDCLHCNRVVYASACYPPSISMDIHLIKMHPREKTTTNASTFPFIDFALSTAHSLQCALCQYTAKESRYMIPHAWTKHTEVAKESEGTTAWTEFEMSAQRKREKQRISCARPMKRLRERIKRGMEGGEEGVGEERAEEGEEGEEGVEEGQDGEKEEEGAEGGVAKRRRLEEGVPATATAFIRTPRQRSAVSRWLDTSMADTSSYSPSTGIDQDLRERLDRLFSGMDSPSTPLQTATTSYSIFNELPSSSMARLAPQGRAEDISHIKGLEGVRCSVCAFKGRDTESLRIHFNQAHQEVSALSIPDVYPCVVCSRVFNSKKKWRCHCEEDHHPKDRPFQCFKCQYRYETHQKLRAHQIRVHESEILVHPDDRTCRECNRLFGSLRAYQNHKKRHEERERMEEEEERRDDY